MASQRQNEQSRTIMLMHTAGRCGVSTDRVAINALTASALPGPRQFICYEMKHTTQVNGKYTGLIKNSH